MSFPKTMAIVTIAVLNLQKVGFIYHCCCCLGACSPAIAGEGAESRISHQEGRKRFSGNWTKLDGTNSKRERLLLLVEERKKNREKEENNSKQVRKPCKIVCGEHPVFSRIVLPNYLEAFFSICLCFFSLVFGSLRFPFQFTFSQKLYIVFGSPRSVH